MIKNKKLILLILVGIMVFPLSVIANVTQVLPNLSLTEQQIHTENRLAKFQRLMKNPQLLSDVGAYIRKKMKNNRLQSLNQLKKVYILANLEPLWTDQKTEQMFLRDYIVFATSGVSNSALVTLKQIIESPKGSMQRDILLTDALLDYVYYSKNVKNNISSWLYQSSTYQRQELSDQLLLQWVDLAKSNYGALFISKYIPSDNKLYTEIINKIVTEAEGNQSIDNMTIVKLALNAQRLRLIPNFNNGVYVNIPAYQLDYYKNGALALHSVVVVGRKKRQTPILFSQLSDVVVNPPWTIPPTILEEDVIPKFAKDPNYGSKKGFEIISYSGEKVEPSSIDWENYKGENVKKFPYMVRQKPGKQAALGRYKFNMPSADAIFLHDTPHKNVFSRKKRALSSGCVRVQKAAELSEILLSEAGWNISKQKEVYRSEKTTFVKIRSENPVYLYYVTAWVENGSVRSVPDVYHLDPKFRLNGIDLYSINTLLK
ncbi:MULTISPECIES: L,D-transpeptidase family protein [Pasteurellaceae]|uniref:L,D-transpeptidase family protein n=1 Tax=Pasteurella atlantica TaxID=2827233 RepID=A0AAW8CFS9_9PAST|nr:L,D-transpeptidase family protein [Pasteurella atlantica]MBR0573798.1 L,D-transpeptidase family protein [Pasteurella atlantica]MDP8039734.1 L,D-transpeptidase family protein [Pasteurella atlantica]MDP8041919.1 L,D-transpeptidase family protein [Pasteurella atlantica]MDP8044056.1 L,D-transpeptidase family protein [Pasteurella atlantica]MDP8046034.1 L,D-transpeptidase family protein [Pasteurella atlantica]